MRGYTKRHYCGLGLLGLLCLFLWALPFLLAAGLVYLVASSLF